MSESLMASTAQTAPVSHARRRRSRLNALEALERGCVLFQSTFPQEAWRYYLGAAPLVVAFIPLWVLDGQVRVSDGGVLMEALLLTAAYAFRTWLVAGYMQRVRQRAFGVPGPKRSGAGASIAAFGRLIAWKITLGLAALATLLTVAGAPWFYAASQFADFDAQEDSRERHSLRGCLALAGQWYGSSLLLFLMMFPLWVAMWLNAAILAVLVPELLHSVLGVNTLLSTRMGIVALMQSPAFWLSLLAVAWMALDPVVKCTFIVVYQHLRSRREGDDLRGLLALLPRLQEEKSESVKVSTAGRRAVVASVIVMAALLMGAPQILFASSVARGAQPQTSAIGADAAAESARAARVGQLRSALDQESHRAIYRWHDSDYPDAPPWLDRLLTRIGDAAERAWEAFKALLRRLWPSGPTLPSGTQGKGGRGMKNLRLWLALVAAFTLAVGGLLVWRRRRREAVQVSLPISAVTPLPDLSDTMVATQREEDEWFALANQLEGQGELRLALRAAYLGLLSGLAARKWLTIRRDRTNREYLDEFARRWRRRPQAAVQQRTEVPEKLRSSLRLFDRVWYGAYAPTPTAVAEYRQDQRELLNHV